MKPGRIYFPYSTKENAQRSDETCPRSQSWEARSNPQIHTPDISSCFLHQDELRLRSRLSPMQPLQYSPVWELCFPQWLQCPLEKGLGNPWLESTALSSRKRGLSFEQGAELGLLSCSSRRQEIREDDALSASSITGQEREESETSFKAWHRCCLSVTPEEALLTVRRVIWPNWFAACSPSRPKPRDVALLRNILSRFPSPICSRHNEVIRSVSISQLRPNPPDFPGGPVAKNPPASVSDMGFIPGPGRFHVLRGN